MCANTQFSSYKTFLLLVSYIPATNVANIEFRQNDYFCLYRLFVWSRSHSLACFCFGSGFFGLWFFDSHIWLKNAFVPPKLLSHYCEITFSILQSIIRHVSCGLKRNWGVFVDRFQALQLTFAHSMALHLASALDTYNLNFNKPYLRADRKMHKVYSNYVIWLSIRQAALIQTFRVTLDALCMCSFVLN